MERFSDPLVDLIAMVMGAQMGKTEALMCVAGHRLDDGPYVPMLWIAPTQKSVKSLADDRFMKMVRSTPDLWRKLEKGRRNRVVEKFIGGVRLGFGWAGSATELASHPAGLVLVDERDRMLSDVEGEGDPLTLARARTKNYSMRKIGVSSTPTIEGASPIWSIFLEGTREKWSWPCPHCGEYFVPRLELLKWPEKATPAMARAEAFVVCPQCGGECRDQHKPAMNAAGRYLAHIEDGDREVAVDDPPTNSVASYWVSGLCSPWQTYGEIAEMLVAAYRSREPERIQGVINTYGGEVWRIKGDAPEWGRVLDTRLHWHSGQVPVGVQMITCGVDVQADRLYYVIRGWGFNAESWLLENGQLFGRTDYDQVWVSLSTLITRTVGDRGLDRVFVDSGYRPGSLYRRPENVIYLFCRRHKGLAFPVKGHDTQDRPLKTADLDLSLQGRTIRGALKLWHIDSDHMKTWLYSRIEWPEGEPGGWHTHAEIDEDYCRQVVSEEVVTKSSGRRTWLERGANHYLDCEYMAYAAALSLNVYHLPELVQAAPETQPTAGRPRQPSAGFQRRGL